MRIIKKVKKQVKQLSQWKQLKEKIKPSEDFNLQNAPPAPHYADLTNWAAHPLLTTKVHFTPKGTIGNNSWKEGEVDCFFVYPTLLFSSHSWNAPLDHPSTNELIQELILPGQASVFNSCCRIFAPKYRQATFYSFFKGSKNSRGALTLAGDDVLNAFDYYINHFNEGRPFFIAGHSQGALHIIRLLEERINNTPLLQRLVAAFPIGYRMPLDKFKRTLHTLKPSTSPTDLHCVVAWDTYLESGKLLKLLDKAEMPYSEDGQLKWEKRAHKRIVGNNPLNWTLSKEIAEEGEHLGGVLTIINHQQKIAFQPLAEEKTMRLDCTGLSAPYPQQVRAKVGKNGALYVSTPKYRAFRSMIMPGKSLHIFDIALFYMDIRKNIEQRWNVFDKKHEMKAKL